jgi:hypothetical protein
MTPTSTASQRLSPWSPNCRLTSRTFGPSWVSRSRPWSVNWDRRLLRGCSQHGPAYGLSATFPGAAFPRTPGSPHWALRRGAPLNDGWDVGLLALAGRATLSHRRWLGTVDWLSHHGSGVRVERPPASSLSRTLGSPPPPWGASPMVVHRPSDGPARWKSTGHGQAEPGYVVRHERYIAQRPGLTP